MMAVRRVPPQMIGIMPSNVRGKGANEVENTCRVFIHNELIHLQKLIDWLGEEVIRFEPYTLGVIKVD